MEAPQQSHKIDINNINAPQIKIIESVNDKSLMSDNLFDKSTAVSGSCFYRSDSGPSLVSQANSFYAYVELRGAGTYRFKVPYSFIGTDSYAQRVPLLKSDKTFLKNLTGNLTAGEDKNAYDIEVAISESDISEGAVYLAYDGYEPYLNTLMIVKDRSYPTEYIPYGEILEVPHQIYKIDINNINAPQIKMIESANDKSVRIVDIQLYANSLHIRVPKSSIVTAAFVTDGFLIIDNVKCTVNSDGNIEVPIDNRNLKTTSGVMSVEIKICDTNQSYILTPPFAFKVRVKPSIIENASINEKSLGRIADIVKEVIAARGNYNTLTEVITNLQETVAQLGDGGSSGDSTTTVISDNLFDKSTAVSGSCFYRSGSGPSLVSQANSFYAYVELRGAGTYRFKVPYSFIGTDSYAKRVPLLKSDKTFLKNLTGNLTAGEDKNAYDIEVVISESDISEGAVYFAYDGYEPYLNTLMIVKDRSYPTEYIPYGEIEVSSSTGKIVNPLYGKTAVFLGDSICAGTTVGDTAPEYGYGWGGIIGEANKMIWDNEGKNGAVITSNVSGATRVVASQVDTALTKHATADYVIFEGGTNDADHLHSDGNKLGTISNNYTTFDTTTFTGAFESLILKILTAYPKAKVGYIIPQKMGQGLFDSENSHRRAYFDRAIEICKKWGIPYIDLWNENPLNPELSLYYNRALDAAGNIKAGKSYTDGQHLTLAGYKKLVPQIENFMLNI